MVVCVCVFYLGVLKSFIFEIQLSNKKINFFIIELPCITITTGTHNFMQVKMHMTFAVVMKNEYIYVYSKRLKDLKFLVTHSTC